MHVRDRLAWGVIAAGVLLLVVLNWHRGREGGVFPQRGLTLICPYSPGGGTDLLSRALAQAVEPVFGRNVTVSNLTGGVGAVGFASGLLARPDGYTLTMVTFELVSLPPQGLVPFTHEDFDLLMRLNMDPAAVTVRADFPADTLEEFLEIARTRANTLSIGHSGTGSVWHLAGELLARAAGFEARFIPFSGAAPAVTSLVGGHIEAVTVSPGEVRSQVLAGQLKILGVMSEHRLPLFPDVPTFRERGIEVVFGTWRGLALPRGVPVPVRQTLLEAFRKALEDPRLVQIAANAGLNMDFADSEGFRGMVDLQSGEVATLMEELGMTR